MSKPVDQRAKGFHFLPEYADLIAHAANRWAYVEYYTNSSIWMLADVPPAIGACMTSQMFTLHAKLGALLSLLKLRKADQTLLKKVNKFDASVRDALDARNRIVHDMWFNDDLARHQMGKLRITAEKNLSFKIDPIPLARLRQDVEIIEVRRAQIGMIRKDIKAALPSLPEIPQTELHPITESPKTL